MPTDIKIKEASLLLRGLGKQYTNPFGYTVEPLIIGTLKSGQPPYNGHTVRPLPIYCPYISTSEEGITSEQQNACPQLVHYSEVPLYLPL